MLKPLRKISNAIRMLRKTAELAAELEIIKSRIDTPSSLFDELESERRTPEYRLRYEKPEPLVSICIATFNRSELLCERAIASIRKQTYQNLEIIVVGDGCTDDTEWRVTQIDDPRIRFFNRSARGTYPEEPLRRWRVAGSAAMNDALDMASGDFITHLDDDDEHEPFRIERLLQHLRSNKLELCFHPFWFETPALEWRQNSADRFQLGSVTTSSIFYDRFFKRIKWDLQAHLLGEPGDWNRLRKMAYLGARTGRYPEPLLRHFRERNQAQTSSNNQKAGG